MSQKTTTNNMVPRTGERFVSLRAEGVKVDAESRTIELSFSSDAPVPMRGWDGDYNEILEHGAGNVRMDRLNSRGPLLYNHNRDELIGVVEKAEVRDGKGYATVRFSKSPEGQKRFDEVQDGILANVSVAYVRHAVERVESKERGLETLRVTDWEPLEVSLVTVPADTSVGVGRNAHDDRTDAVAVRSTENPKQEITMAEITTTAPVAQVDEVKAERKRVSEIEALARTLAGKQIDVSNEAEKAKAEGWSVDQFRAAALEKVPGVKPAAPVTIPQETAKRYSLLRAIKCAQLGKLDGAEGEIHQELLRNRGTAPAEMGILVPSELFGLRSLTAGASGSGADLVNTQYGDVIGKLDNQPVVRRAGARMLNGLVGDLILPRISGGTTAYWVGETASVTASDLSTDNVKMTPHRLGVLTKISNQLSAQSAPSVEQLVREDIAKRIEIALDLAAFQGKGAAGEPKGLFQIASVNTNTYSAAATMALVAAALKELATDNVSGDIAGIIDPTTWGKWVAKSVDSGSGRFLWTGGLGEGVIAPGVRGFVSNHLPSNKSVFGLFSDMLIGTWQSVNLIVDPYTSKHLSLVEIYGEVLCDIVVRHPESFVVSTDSAAQ